MADYNFLPIFFYFYRHKITEIKLKITGLGISFSSSNGNQKDEYKITNQEEYNKRIELDNRRQQSLVFKIKFNTFINNRYLFYYTLILQLSNVYKFIIFIYIEL